MNGNPNINGGQESNFFNGGTNQTPVGIPNVAVNNQMPIPNGNVIPNTQISPVPTNSPNVAAPMPIQNGPVTPVNNQPAPPIQNNNQFVNPQMSPAPQPVDNSNDILSTDNTPNDSTPKNDNLDDDRLINQSNVVDDSNLSNINDLNVNGTYNHMEAPAYVNDEKVLENINEQKKNTVPISKELKTVILIALLLLVFIIVMPMLADIITDMRFR